MKAIMKSIKPKTCANIMNLIQSILVIKNKREAMAIQKLIDVQGYAEIYVYCSKINKKHYHLIESIDTDIGKKEYEIDYYIGSEDYLDYCYEGKIAFKFRCYKIEEIEVGTKENIDQKDYSTFYSSVDEMKLFKASCLDAYKILKYAGYCDDFFRAYKYKIYAIHISDLEIFDKPKELSEFKHYKRFDCYNADFDYTTTEYRKIRLTKAPQNFCCVEVCRSYKS